MLLGYSFRTNVCYYRDRPTEGKQKKVKAAPKPKPLAKVKVEEDEEGWTEVSAGARPTQVLPRLLPNGAAYRFCL